MSSSAPQARFPIKVALSGHFRYYFTDNVVAESVQLATEANGSCVLTLEFVQHGPGRELD